MKPIYDPQTHRLARVRLTVWKPMHQQTAGGPLTVEGFVLRKVRKRFTRRRPAPSPVTAGTTEQETASPKPEIFTSEDGCLIARRGPAYWVCLLTGRERRIVKAVAESGGILSGDSAIGLMKWKSTRETPPTEEELAQRVRAILSSVNAKLRRKKIPFRYAFRGWTVTVEEIQK